MKKIHEGCLAVYIAHECDRKGPADGNHNTGTIVKVGKPLGRLPEFVPHEFFWEVDKKICYYQLDGPDVFFKVAPESRLQPIDEDDSTETAENSDDEVLETIV